MQAPTDRELFDARCVRIAAAAHAAGVELRKAPGRHALIVSRPGRSIEFPILTDEEDWRETTPPEALYAVLLDSRDFAAARLDDATVATLDESERAAVPFIRREMGDEEARLQQLRDLFGGQAVLDAMWAHETPPPV